MHVFYQMIGFGALISLGLSYWQKKKERILLWQMAANFIFAAHYYLLGAQSGALCSFFQILVLALFLLRDRYGWSRAATAIPVAAVFVAIAVITYETPVSLLPIFASLTALLPFFQSNRRVIQLSGVVSALAWLIYVISVRSYSGIITESLLTVITASSLWKKEERSLSE